MAVDMKANNSYGRGVLMIGTAIGDRGGIGSVVATLRDNGLFDRNQIEYIATHLEGTTVQKIVVAASAWFRCMVRMIMGRVDCLHVHMASRASFWRKVCFIVPAFIFRIPVILHLHGGEFHNFYAHECTAIGKWCVRSVFRRASAVIALSHSWAQWLREALGEINAIVIHNPISVPPDSGLKRDNEAILFLGRLGEKKGTFVLLEAVSLLASAGIAVKLWLGGDGDIDTVRKQAADLGIAESVELLGWVTGDAKQRLLSTAGIYCLPSFNEGLPISLLEAMAIGMPVITTPVGGIPEAVTDGIEGFLVAPGDSVTLAERLSEVIGDPQRAQQMGMEGRQRVLREFAADVVLPKIEAVYGALRRCQD